MRVSQLIAASLGLVWTTVLVAGPFKITPGALPEDPGEMVAPLPRPLALSEAMEAPLPAHWDWRDVGGNSYLPPVSNQGTCGACVSFAIVSALEATLNIACDDPSQSFDLSRQFVFSCGGGACRGGLKVSDGMQFLKSTGAPDSMCFPYGALAGQDVACANACNDWQSRTINGLTFETPTTGRINIVAIKRALLKGPLVSNMILFEDLATYTSGVYRHQTGIQLGSHAMVIVGWDDADAAWIVRNSLGAEWGEDGYFRIAWNDVSLPGRYTWAIDVSEPRNRGICLYPRMK